MKVAFVSYEYGFGNMYGENKPYIYGGGRYTASLVNNLRKLVVDVDVFTVNRYIRKIGVPLFMIKNGLKEFGKYDVVHSNESAGAFVRHPNKVETFHHDYTPQGVLYILYSLPGRLAIRSAKHVIVPSHASKQSIQNLETVQNEKISVIYHGVDKQVFNCSELNRNFAKSSRSKNGLTDRFTIISVGRLEKHKRQRDIIEAISGLKKVVFILVGRGSQRNSIISLAKRRRVRLLHFDYVPDSKLAVLYNASDVYVHTSLIEGFGLPILEAMACGVPIIAYNTADFEYLVKEWGCLLRKGDSVGVKHALTFLRENEKERKIMGRKAEKRSNLFSWEKSAAAHLKVYRSVYAHD